MSNSIDKASSESSLYAKSEKIYPREVAGQFQSLRWISMYALLGLYYILPWVSWNGRQAVLFDLPARKFHIFFLTFWPQDFFFLSLLLILAGLSLFFFTAIAGRVWCGFACPQTVWTEAFVMMERWVEGSRAQQIKLARAPWSLLKVRKRALKHTLWISFSLFTGLTFVGYFQPVSELFAEFFKLELSGWALFWVVFYGFATYGNAGFMREQVCKYMCPYARFQSAMFDKDTLIVAYDEQRGEPRGRGTKRIESRSSKGDCVDCGICVQVCPTGIDIREGLQYECIACAACIDGCDDVMQKIGLPTGLIRYSTQSQDQGESKPLGKALWRPRIIIYGLLLVTVFSGFIVALSLRSSVQVDILRDRNALFRWSQNNDIENSYQVRVMNKSQARQHYSVSVSGLDGATARWSKTSGESLSRVVEAGAIGEFNVLVNLPASADYQRSQKISLHVTESVGRTPQTSVEETRFWGPPRRN
ncbi:cytochrome c oxidase accessory protein CcoG [Arenicella sp. 4NH20-0111]|uniref:cytochrome c oxidase accessory protein CcoG n=1 Tax=Arenicella sp. 4NH20-0111 TaxID=3127648 RepID=UPI003101F480